MNEGAKSPRQSFLDPEAMAGVVERIRSQHAPWFNLADRAHGIAVRALPMIRPPVEDNQRLVAAALYGRTLTSFESAYLLAERGLSADARSLVRALVESTIVLCALAVDPPSVLDQLLCRELVNRRKLLNAWLEDPEAIAAMSEEKKTMFRESLAEVRRMRPDLKDDPIDVRRLAGTCGLLSMYNTAYRMLSSDSAHASLQSLEHHIKANSSEILGLKYGPDPVFVPRTLSSAVPTLLSATFCATELFGVLSYFRSELEETLASWKALGEPS